MSTSGRERQLPIRAESRHGQKSNARCRAHSGLGRVVPRVIGPTGRIQVAAGSTFTRGTNFMGVDFAEWLEHQLKLDQCKP